MAFEEEQYHEQDTVDTVIPHFEHPKGRIDKLIFQADRPVMHEFATNKVNTTAFTILARPITTVRLSQI